MLDNNIGRMGGVQVFLVSAPDSPSFALEMSSVWYGEESYLTEELTKGDFNENYTQGHKGNSNHLWTLASQEVHRLDGKGECDAVYILHYRPCNPEFLRLYSFKQSFNPANLVVSKPPVTSKESREGGVLLVAESDPSLPFVPLHGNRMWYPCERSVEINLRENQGFQSNYTFNHKDDPNHKWALKSIEVFNPKTSSEYDAVYLMIYTPVDRVFIETWIEQQQSA